MSYDDPESENNGPFVVNESKDILMNSWRTELNAPEILPYKEELVAEIQEFLSDQEVTDQLRLLLLQCRLYYMMTSRKCSIKVRYGYSYDVVDSCNRMGMQIDDSITEPVLSYCQRDDSTSTVTRSL
jgi:hypothetical protein